MKKIGLVFLCIGMLLTAGAGNVFALYIDFDDVANYEVIDTKYAPALTLSSIKNEANTLSVLPIDTGTDVVGRVSGDSIGISADNFQGLLLTFGDLMSSVTVQGFDWGGNQEDDNETMYLSAFDASGILLGSDSFSGAYNSPNTRLGTLTYDNIKYVAFTFGNTTLGFYGIDFIDTIEMTNSVPEPSVLLLLGSGLVALSAFRRKRLFK